MTSRPTAARLARDLRLYALTADGGARDPAGKTRVRAWLEAGVRAVQLRETQLPPDQVVGFGRFLRAVTAEYGALLIVNDDPQLAQLIEADGCHLGQEDMRPALARKILGPEKLIGLSTHSRAEVLTAAEKGVDYIGVGPIFQSSTKDVGRALLGPEFAGWAAARSGLPVVAIGGVTLDNVGQLVAAGCPSVAVLGALNQPPEPGAAARAFLEALSPRDSAPLP